MCELLPTLSHSYDIYSEFEVSLLYTLGLCALHYALQAWLEEKTNVALSLFISFCAVDNLYPPGRNQTVHQPLWLSCRLVDKTIHCGRREVKSFEFHESLVFFIFFLLDTLSTLVSWLTRCNFELLMMQIRKFVNLINCFCRE